VAIDIFEERQKQGEAEARLEKQKLSAQSTTAQCRKADPQDQVVLTGLKPDKRGSGHSCCLFKNRTWEFPQWSYLVLLLSMERFDWPASGWQHGYLQTPAA
ncbi:hypothetical protein, partial [Yoonia sp. R2-816]|uniref:hypothetical protein n=1 Tax=Yoonia sp. R2-816 TaxID=3342638 RepID=UPI00372AD341